MIAIVYESLQLNHLSFHALRTPIGYCLDPKSYLKTRRMRLEQLWCSAYSIEPTHYKKRLSSLDFLEERNRWVSSTSTGLQKIQQHLMT